MELQYKYALTRYIEQTEETNATYEIEFQLNLDYDNFRLPDLRFGLVEPYLEWCRCNIGPYKEGNWFYYLSKEYFRIQIDDKEKVLLFKLECC